MRKLLLLVLTIFFAFSLIVYWVSAGARTEGYFSPVEARYITENIIQNSEGHVYEYEYVFEYDDKEFYYHSNEKLTFQEETSLAFKKDKSKKFIFSEEYERPLKQFQSIKKTCFKIWKILIIISVLIIFSMVISKIKIYAKRKRQEKKDKLRIEVKLVNDHIAREYEEYSSKILPLLKKSLIS